MVVLKIRSNIKMNAKGVAKFIDNSAYKAAEAHLNEIKAEMRFSGPNVYIDRGMELSRILKAVKLEPVQGALQAAWENNVESLNVNKSYKVANMSLFNSRYLNNGTKWKGVSSPPKGHRTIGRKKREHDKKWQTGRDINMDNIKAGPVVVDDSGYRPLPSSKQGFTWAKNPYPGYGYWLLYERGLMGGGIVYPASHFISNALGSIVGIQANNLIVSGKTGNIKLSEKFINTFTNQFQKRLGEFR